MDITIQKEDAIQEIENQPVAVLLLRNYIHAQVPHAKKGYTPCLNEVEEANQKGLGVSLNSVFFLRSIDALGSKDPAPDISFLYGDLRDNDSWKEISELEEHLKTDKGCFNEGISFKDGFIFGFDKHILEDAIGPVGGDSKLKFYHHKVVGGEPRGEFYSVMNRVYGTDMRSTLAELFEPKGIGSGTTSIVSDQCFGALSAGPFCNSIQYRLRKTKVSNTMEIGHLLIYNSRLKEDVIDRLHCAGFDFSDVLDPSISLADTVCYLIDSFRNAEIRKRYARPSELFKISKTLIYSEKDDNDVTRLICKSGSNGDERLVDITDYAFSSNMIGRCE